LSLAGFRKGSSWLFITVGAQDVQTPLLVCFTNRKFNEDIDDREAVINLVRFRRILPSVLTSRQTFLPLLVPWYPNHWEVLGSSLL
jgi:hypothetical protein